MRRLALVAALICLPLAAPAGERDGPPPDKLPLQLQRADGGWVTPDRLVIGGRAFALPGDARVRDHNRVDLGGIPLLGDLTGEVLAPDNFAARVPVGRLWLTGRDVVIDLADPSLAALPLSVMADLPRHGRVEFLLLPGRALGSGPTNLAGAPDGEVFLLDRRGGGRRLVAVAGPMGRYLLE